MCLIKKKRKKKREKGGNKLPDYLKLGDFNGSNLSLL